jgi:2-methylcitrate dehydratase PrpD
MDASLSLSIGRYAASTSIERLPDEVKERAKHVILDEMASATFGRQRLAGELGARYALSFGGAPEALVLGTERRVAAPYAALANGTAGHADEVDGVHLVGGHPGATIVHAALAMAERQRVTGAELVNAVVLGYDVAIRIVSACGGFYHIKDRYRVYADFLFPLGAAVAACRLLGLDAVRHSHAMALVTFQANGLCALFDERRHISKAFCNGQYAFASVSAALMAAAGLEGSDDIVGAKYGVLEAWGLENGPELVLEGLGKDHAIMGANFKFLNAGYPIHTPVEAVMTLVREHSINADAISGVHVGMASNALRIVDNRQMHNICVQDMLTAALLRGGLHLCESPFPLILQDPRFAPLRARITTAVDPELERDLPNGRAAKVTITTAAGGSFSHRVDWPRGHTRRGGVSWSDLAEKWHNGLPHYDIDAMIALASVLEELDDVRMLTEAFTPPRNAVAGV